MKKHAVTLILAVCAIALGAWLWFGRTRATTDERKRREQSVFPIWRAEELTDITIAHDGETLVLSRMRGARPADAEWRMLAPRLERADTAAVTRLVTTLEYAAIARRVSDGSSSELGLVEPRATGSLRMGALVIPFALGAAAPRPEGSAYMRVADEPIIVASKELVETLLAPFDSFRDRTVVPYLSTELQAMRIEHAAGGFTLERLDDRSFRIAAAHDAAPNAHPNGLLVARSSLDRIWAALAEMRAEAFLKDADAERLTARPALKLLLTSKDVQAPPAEILVGDACPSRANEVVVLRKTPSRVLACAPKDIVGAFLVDANAIVERRPFTLRMDEIEELRLEWLPTNENAGTPAWRAATAPRAIEIARKDMGFREREPQSRDLPADEAEAASQLVSRIASSEGKLIAPSDEPFDPVARARVRSGEHEQVIEIARPDTQGNATARRTLDGARLALPAAVVRRLVPRETTLRAPRIVATEARRATRVNLSCGVSQELVDRGDGFRFIEPTGYEADGSIADFVDALLKGKIDLWAADDDDGTFAFEKDACHVTLAFEDASAPMTVWFGSEGEGGVYGRTDTQRGVFIAPLALRDLAAKIYVSRASLRIPADQIEEVRVTFEGRAVSGADVDSERRALAGLNADRVLSIGKHAPRVGQADLTIDVRNKGAPERRRLLCRASDGSAKTYACTIDTVDAEFEVDASRLAPFLPRTEVPDGSTPRSETDARP